MAKKQKKQEKKSRVFRFLLSNKEWEMLKRQAFEEGNLTPSAYLRSLINRKEMKNGRRIESDWGNQ
jgi:hypothetical protein